MPGRRHAYPARVRFEIAETDLASYRRAADFLNVNSVDVLCVQHEYGIFGGKAGSHVLALLRELRMPIVTTLHTILARAEPAAARSHGRADAALGAAGRHERARARRCSATVHGVPRDKIDLHPARHLRCVRSTGRSKDQLGVEGKTVILTFGLLSPDKGIEHVIDALPAILARHPETVYIVLGATHPHVKEHHGETYRLMLEARAQRLGVDASMIFHNRFVSQDELTEFLAAADIYITPYLKPEQITSGTLAYAVGAGKAVISTPYWYAQRAARRRARHPGAVARLRSDRARGHRAPRRRRASGSRCGERAAAYGRDMTLAGGGARATSTASSARAPSTRDRLRTAFQAQTLAQSAGRAARAQPRSPARA